MTAVIVLIYFKTFKTILLDFIMNEAISEFKLWIFLPSTVNIYMKICDSKTPLHDPTTPFSTCRPWGFVKSQFDNYGY
jgi:hypothetical protein